MDLFSDLISAVQSDLTIDNNSSLFPPVTVQLAINRSYRKIGGLHLWPETEDAQKTSSVANQEYYDFPETWLAYSLWKLTVDDVDYFDPIAFADFQNEKENNWPSGLKKAFTQNQRKFFIYPIPTTNGNNNISVWGQKAVDKLVNPTDTTIFSYSLPEVNEAIVLEAGAILKLKGQIEQPVQRSFIGGTLLLSMEAQNVVGIAWRKVQTQKMKTEKIKPFFDVPDFFAPRIGRNKTKLGEFDI